MNIYDVYMDGEEAVISATGHEIDDDGILRFFIETKEENENLKIFESVAAFQANVWLWFEKRQVEEK